MYNFCDLCDKRADVFDLSLHVCYLLGMNLSVCSECYVINQGNHPFGINRWGDTFNIHSKIREGCVDIKEQNFRFFKLLKQGRVLKYKKHYYFSSIIGNCRVVTNKENCYFFEKMPGFQLLEHIPNSLLYGVVAGNPIIKIERNDLVPRKIFFIRQEL